MKGMSKIIIKKENSKRNKLERFESNRKGKEKPVLRTSNKNTDSEFFIGLDIIMNSSGGHFGFFFEDTLDKFEKKMKNF